MPELQYRIEGSELQYVEITLAAGAPGAMMYADQDVAIDTRMGNGDDAGFGGRFVDGIKRSLTAESFFTSVFTNTGSRPLRVALAAPSPGKIIAVDLASMGGLIICQKGLFRRLREEEDRRGGDRVALRSSQPASQERIAGLEQLAATLKCDCHPSSVDWPAVQSAAKQWRADQ